MGQLQMNIPQNFPLAIKLIYRVHSQYKLIVFPCEMTVVVARSIGSGDFGLPASRCSNYQANQRDRRH